MVNRSSSRVLMVRWDDRGKAARVRGILVASALTSLLSPHCCFVHTGARCASLPPPTGVVVPALEQKGKGALTSMCTNKPERQPCATRRDLPSDCGKCLNGKEEKRVEVLPHDIMTMFVTILCHYCSTCQVESLCHTSFY